jgi:hypothetical protein
LLSTLAENWEEVYHPIPEAPRRSVTVHPGVRGRFEWIDISKQSSQSEATLILDNLE